MIYLRFYLVTPACRKGHEAEGIGSLFEVNVDLEFSDLVVVMEFKAGLVNS